MNLKSIGSWNQLNPFQLQLCYIFWMPPCLFDIFSISPPPFCLMYNEVSEKKIVSCPRLNPSDPILVDVKVRLRQKAMLM